jgi:DNA-binding response OmpR family regulator
MNRIAIIDDDAPHSRAVARLLRASGMQTSVFLSAEDFLARRGERSFDAIVLDLQLGGMSGFELQKRLASGGQPPVVFLTAHEEPETLARAAEAGCTLVRKTDPCSVLLEAVRRAMAARGRFPKG